MNIKKAKEDIKNTVRAYLKKNDYGQYSIPSIRQRPMLLMGPPGIGKTQIMQQIAQECKIGLVAYTITHHTRQSAVGLPFIKEKTFDGKSYSVTEYTMSEIIYSIYQYMEESGKKEGILFIDEIHRLSRAVEEVLYPAMEDYALDIIIGKGPSARSIRIDLPKFTLIGATTRAGQMTSPLRDRFGMLLRLELYKPEELCQIITRSAKILEVECEEEGALELARRSRGTPRIANRLLKRVRDYALVLGDGKISREIADVSLDKMEIDKLGLDSNDIRILKTIIRNYGGGPVGAAGSGGDLGRVVRGGDALAQEHGRSGEQHQEEAAEIGYERLFDAFASLRAASYHPERHNDEDKDGNEGADEL